MAKQQDRYKVTITFKITMKEVDNLKFSGNNKAKAIKEAKELIDSTVATATIFDTVTNKTEVIKPKRK